MKYLVFALALLVGLTAYAADEEDQTDADMVVMKKCLKHWDTHPFGKSPEFKVMTASVKVLGIGKNPEDLEETERPKLVLVKPTVNVLGKLKYKLMNPNGWYCLKQNTAVLAKTEIVAHCQAHIASSSDGVAVLGSNEDDQGVTVLGKTEIIRKHCKSKE